VPRAQSEPIRPVRSESRSRAGDAASSLRLRAAASFTWSLAIAAVLVAIAMLTPATMADVRNLRLKQASVEAVPEPLPA
jgi:hypothetical protein